MIRSLGKALLGSPRRAAISLVVVALGVSVVYGAFPALREFAAWMTLPAGVIGGLVLAFPNETKRLIGRVLAQIAWLNKSIERESVRQDLEGTLSSGLHDLSRASPHSVASRVRVEFVRTGEEVAELPDGTIVVGIANHKDRTRNLVAAAWAFARNAVIPYARPHLDRDVSRGLDFAVTKLILSRADVRAVSEFIRDIWVPSIQDQARLRDLTAKLEILEDDELLGPVLLKEFAELGLRQANRFPTDEVATETAAFVEHLAELAQREPGTHVETHFDGKYIRCGFVLLARPDVMATKGEDAYRDAVDWAIRNAYQRVYVVAKGRHVASARSVCANFLSDPRVLQVREYVAQMSGPGATTLDRLVTQIKVDVRSYVGIGQRPILAVGTTYEEAARLRRARQRAGKPT